MTYGTLIPDASICFLLAMVSRGRRALGTPPADTSWGGLLASWGACFCCPIHFGMTSGSSPMPLAAPHAQHTPDCFDTPPCPPSPRLPAGVLRDLPHHRTHRRHVLWTQLPGVVSEAPAGPAAGPLLGLPCLLARPSACLPCLPSQWQRNGRRSVLAVLTGTALSVPWYCRKYQQVYVYNGAYQSGGMVSPRARVLRHT